MESHKIPWFQTTNQIMNDNDISHNPTKKNGGSIPLKPFKIPLLSIHPPTRTKARLT